MSVQNAVARPFSHHPPSLWPPCHGRGSQASALLRVHWPTVWDWSSPIETLHCAITPIIISQLVASSWDYHKINILDYKSYFGYRYSVWTNIHKSKSITLGRKVHFESEIDNLCCFCLASLSKGPKKKSTVIAQILPHADLFVDFRLTQVYVCLPLWVNTKWSWLLLSKENIGKLWPDDWTKKQFINYCKHGELRTWARFDIGDY